LELTVACLGLSCAVLIPAACLSPNPAAWTAPQFPAAAGSLVVLGVFSTGMGMLMFNQLVQQQGPLFAVMVTNLTPIGALVLGWADAERVTGLQLAALVGVLICVAVVQWGAAAPQK
jgi:drug/metabolite transporter (DMT)-like permease